MLALNVPKRPPIRMMELNDISDQEPDAWKLARPVLRRGKPVRVYLFRSFTRVKSISSSSFLPPPGERI